MPFLQSLHPAPDQVSVAFMGKGSFDCKADIFEIVRSTIEPGAIILDVGGNIGTNALSLAALNLDVHAFEAMPANFAHLELSRNINGFRNLKLNNLAVSSQTGLTLRVCHVLDNYGTGFLSVVNHLFDERSIAKNATVCPSEVHTITLDDYVERERIQKIGLLKMDIEGSEGLALKGFSRTLRTAPPQFIILEFFARWLNSTDVGAVQVLQMLVGGGYLLLPQTTAYYSAELGRYVHEFPCEAPCLREWIRKSHEDELLRIEQDYLHTRFYADLTFIHGGAIDRYTKLLKKP